MSTDYLQQLSQDLARLVGAALRDYLGLIPQIEALSESSDQTVTSLQEGVKREAPLALNFFILAIKDKQNELDKFGAENNPLTLLPLLQGLAKSFTLLVLSKEADRELLEQCLWRSDDIKNNLPPEGKVFLQKWGME